MIANKLKALGFNPWFDQWDGHGTDGAYISITKQGMIDGVQRSAALVLVLSKSIFQRPFCRLEVITAVKARKPIITPSKLREKKQN